MPLTRWRDRDAATIENASLRVTVLREGGHVAEILHKQTGVSPLWVPPWPTIEPSRYHPDTHPEYGRDAESKLLAGIHGHNVCLDLSGTPSQEEAAAGIPTHGEGGVAPYTLSETGDGALHMHAELPLHGLSFERTIRLDGDRLCFAETVENLTPMDRPIAYTQHVTLGPPFLERGKTEFRIPGSKSMTYPSDFGGPDAYLPIAAEFDWPHAPRPGGGTLDMRRLPDLAVSSGFTANLLDRTRERGWFLAWSPGSQLLLGYEWSRADFPWIGMWDENHSRQTPPWNGNTFARGMEFSVSPFPESRRAMIDRRDLFGVPGYRWLSANGRIQVSFSALLRQANEIPEDWPDA